MLFTVLQCVNKDIIIIMLSLVSTIVSLCGLVQLQCTYYATTSCV